MNYLKRKLRLVLININANILKVLLIKNIFTMRIVKVSSKSEYQSRAYCHSLLYEGGSLPTLNPLLSHKLITVSRYNFQNIKSFQTIKMLIS